MMNNIEYMCRVSPVQHLDGYLEWWVKDRTKVHMEGQHVAGGMNAHTWDGKQKDTI
jgi:hypothetical protein